MSIISKICITAISGENMRNMDSVEVVANKGIVGDRYFAENNEADVQITLIESENIEHYNEVTGTNVSHINFRRNIITKGIQLNNLIGKEFLLGKVKVKGHRLCDPCKYLQDIIKDDQLVKKLVNRGGLRCEILSSGNITVNDSIQII